MVAPTASEPRTNNNGHRLYVKGKHVAFKRGKHTLRPNTSLIKIEGVDDPQAAHFYLGKRIAYVYRGKKEIRGTKIRVIWGKVARPHGEWQLWRGEGALQAQPPPEELGRYGARHALPILDIDNPSTSIRRGGGRQCSEERRSAGCSEQIDHLLWSGSTAMTP
ncbi:hypothetical protein KC335_g17041 [Hortaea werneckii]|nr:hypothetical protein KC335_g17041 [Hortaea werneckii]